MGIDDLQYVQACGDDDAQVAVAPEVVAQVADIIRRIAAVEFVGRPVREFVGVLFVLVQQPVRLLETLVAAVVPVDAVDHRRETSDHEGDFPVAFVVDLPRAGEDAGQRCGLLDIRHVVGRVVYRRIADEIDVRGDGQSQVDLAAGVAADHLGLQCVQFGRTREVLVGVGVILPLERLVCPVFVDVERQPRSHRTVEYGQFPVLFVVYLSVAGQDGRDPADLRERHRVAHEPAFLVPHGIRFGLDAGQPEPHERVRGADVVRTQCRHGE